MKALATLLGLSEEPTTVQVAAIKSLGDVELENAKRAHFAKPQVKHPGSMENVGVLFVFALLGAPYALVAAALTADRSWLISVAVLLALGVAAWMPLRRSVLYWREHRAIQQEEMRRFGAVTFGG
jgi:cytochrome c biogenesis protein CcdA